MAATIVFAEALVRWDRADDLPAGALGFEEVLSLEPIEADLAAQRVVVERPAS